MSYTRPSVLVSQDLANSGGVANTTPDLEACIIGPAYNVLSYVAGSTISQVTTAALSAVSTTGAIDANSLQLTVASTANLSVGDVVIVSGAGLSGANLQAAILGISGNVLALDTIASTTVTAASVHKSGHIYNGAVENDFYLPGKVPGQEPVASSVNVWLLNAFVNTAVFTGTGSVGTNVITATGTAVGNVNTTTNTLKAEVGDKVSISDSDTTGVVSYIKTITTSSGLNGNITGITLIDLIPSTLTGTLTVTVLKQYNNVQVLAGSLDLTFLGTLSEVKVLANPLVTYGTVVSGDVYIEYKALRKDLSAQILSINNVADLEQQLGVITDENPLALGVDLALANTTTRIRAIAVTSNDFIGYQLALSLAESERLYALVPLSQDPAIISLFPAHVKQLSTPESASWRVAIINPPVPLTVSVGTANSIAPNVNSTNNIASVNGNIVLNSSTATFVSDGAVPGDTVNVVAPSPAIGAYVVQDVINTQLIISAAPITASGIHFYITRNLTKTASANSMAAEAAVEKSNRVWLVQPDSVGLPVNGVTKYLPGYYLAAAHAGMVAGFPPQQSFTNIGVAGITDLQHSNYYFGKADMNNMAGSGVCLYVQDIQGGTPYCRHALTTDVSTLEYREQMAVRVWDYISYFYADLLKSFIGVWNITPESLNTVRQTINAGAELLKSKKLPKIGSPLIDLVIKTLEQDANNKDHVHAVLAIKIPYAMNYIDLHLVI